LFLKSAHFQILLLFFLKVEDEETSEWKLEGDGVVIGRQPTAHINLKFATVSGRHAAITRGRKKGEGERGRERERERERERGRDGETERQGRRQRE
jgi:hypothetical protein